jgi:hypothetical protein
MVNSPVRGNMVNLENDTPYFYWTFDRLGDLEQGQNQYGFDGSVWKADVIQSYQLGEGQVSFDSPTEWAKGSVACRTAAPNVVQKGSSTKQYGPTRRTMSC